MTAPEPRNIRTVLIPWVMALVALFGLNAITTDQFRSRKGEAPEEVGITQLADDASSSGRISNPQIFIIPEGFHEVWLPQQSCFLPRVEIGAKQPTVAGLRGAVQGRAPPAGSFC